MNNREAMQEAFEAFMANDEKFPDGCNMTERVFNAGYQAALASQAQQPTNEEKALYWFNCLSKVAALLEIPNDQPITSAPEVLENLLQSQSADRKSSITFQQYEAFTMAVKQVAKERMPLPPAPEGGSDGGKCGAGGYCITCPNMPAPEGGDK